MHQGRNTKIKKEIKCFCAACLPAVIQPCSHETHTHSTTAYKLVSTVEVQLMQIQKGRGMWCHNEKGSFVHEQLAGGVPFAPVKRS